MSNKTQDIIKEIQEGVVNIFNSENYRRYLKFHDSFHKYSINNQILIWMQNPESTAVAGYKKWNELGRQVRKGEKGIKIFAPYIKKIENEDGTEEKISSFFVTTVFDVSQTDGEEIPSIVGEEKTGDIDERMLKAVEAVSKYPIVYAESLNGASGLFNSFEGVIKILETQSGIQRFTTLIHELAHSRLHNANDGKSRADRETEAESIACIVANHYGIDTTEFTFGYIASWARGKKSDELLKVLKGIQTEADKIIEELDAQLCA